MAMWSEAVLSGRPALGAPWRSSGLHTGLEAAGNSFWTSTGVSFLRVERTGHGQTGAVLWFNLALSTELLPPPPVRGKVELVSCLLEHLPLLRGHSGFL